MPGPAYADGCLVNGQEFRALDAAFPGGVCTAGTYWALPPIGIEPDHSGPVWTDTLIRFIGERTGIGRKRLNYELRYAWIDLVIVGTPAQVRASKKSLLNSLTDLPRYSIWLPDDVAAINGCTLMPMPRTLQKTFASGKIARILPCVFEQMSEEN